MTRSLHPRRAFVTAAVLVGLFGAIGCEVLGRDPDLATLMIYLPGNDTVLVDLKSGEITSGPIAMYTDIEFTAEFFASDGTPDGRVTEQRFRLDVTSGNTSIVTYTRLAGFGGAFNRIAPGDTQVRFALYNLETMMNDVDVGVDITVY